MKLRMVPGTWGKLPKYLREAGGNTAKAAANILKKMTLDEKIEQMNGDQPLVRGTIEMMSRYNREPIPAGENFRLGIPGIRFSDGPRGVVMYSSTCFPIAMARGATWDTELEGRIGNTIGVEARTQGANFFGGVCVNLLRHPAWGRAQETYGEDPLLLGKMGGALTEAVQRHIMACVKHFACNSVENTRFKIDVQIDERTLRELYLPHFKHCIDKGAASVMSAYNRVNGEYCGENRKLLHDILKGEWGFSGFVISDFLFGLYNPQKGIEAGLDIEMPFRRKYGRKLKALLRKGIVDEAKINGAVERILTGKLRFAAKQVPEELYSPEKIACEEHTTLAREAAEKSMVLLKNDGPLLPFDCRDSLQIAVLGKMAGRANIGDRGSSGVFPPYAVSPIEGIFRYVRGNGGEGGCRIKTYLGNSKEKAAALARESDVCVLVTGYTWRDEGENMMFRGGDRDHLRLKKEKEEYILAVTGANPRTVVVLESGSAVVMENWKDKAASILMAWYPGMEGGNALARVLFGAVNPSGKLPFVVPKREEDLPFFDPNAPRVTYEYYHGYRLLQKKGVEPAFPFGFGLHYTEFTYTGLKTDKTAYHAAETITVAVAVKNTGEMEGDEIIQVYSSQHHPPVDRPVLELRGFRRTSLSPGAAGTAQIAVPVQSLGYVHPETMKWTLDAGNYFIFAGPSSAPESLLQTEIAVVTRSPG